MLSEPRKGIQWSIHAMKYIWTENQGCVGWGMLLVDTRNLFKEINQTTMLWHIRNTCTVGAQFSFNTFRNWKVMKFQGRTVTVNRKQGVPQDDPLDITLYGIVMIPIIKELQHRVQDVEQQRLKDTLQVWYADESEIVSTFTCIKAWFSKL